MRWQQGGAFGCALVILGTAVGLSADPPNGALRARAQALMSAAPLVDGHNDLAWALRDTAAYDLDKVDIRAPQPKLQTDIARLRAGHLGAQFWSVYVPAGFEGQRAVTATLEQIDAVHQIVRRYPDVFELATRADDVERVFRSGRIASLIGMEGGHSIDNSLGALRMFYRMGARYMTLAHGGSLAWVDSATDAPRANGLSSFGEAVVREMNWLGMLVDLSHVSPAAMKAAIRVSEAPVIFSHSSARALCDVPRNVPDDVLRLVPQNRGVVMVTFVPSFVSPAVAAHFDRYQEQEKAWKAQHLEDTARKAAESAWRAANPAPVSTLAQVVDHIDHVRKVAGIDHVGIGSDFDGIDFGPQGLEDVSKFPDLIAELLRRGYSDADVRKVMGGNVLRVMREAEQVAARLQTSRGPSVERFGEKER
jgi:membrane dipeptidase